MKIGFCIFTFRIASKLALDGGSGGGSRANVEAIRKVKKQKPIFMKLSENDLLGA